MQIRLAAGRLRREAHHRHDGVAAEANHADVREAQRREFLQGGMRLEELLQERRVLVVPPVLSGEDREGVRLDLAWGERSHARVVCGSDFAADEEDALASMARR